MKWVPDQWFRSEMRFRLEPKHQRAFFNLVCSLETDTCPKQHPPHINTQMYVPHTSAEDAISIKKFGMGRTDTPLHSANPNSPSPWLLLNLKEHTGISHVMSSLKLRVPGKEKISASYDDHIFQCSK